MVGWEVERVEVELFGLDLGPFGQLPTHRDKGVGDVFGQDCDRVTGADGLTCRRQRHVDALGDQDRGVAFGAQQLEARVVAALRLSTDHVHAFSCVGSIGLRQRSERLACQREWRAVAQVLRLGARKGVEVLRQIEGVFGRADQFGQRFLR